MPASFSLAGFERLAVFGGAAFAIQGGLRLCEHHGNRRAEFVRGVRGGLFCECQCEAVNPPPDFFQQRRVKDFSGRDIATPAARSERPARRK